MSSFAIAYVCVSMHTWVLIQTVDLYSTLQENYSIRLLSVKKLKDNLFLKNSFTGDDSISNLGQNSNKIFTMFLCNTYY
jgi:hypothetical protein